MVLKNRFQQQQATVTEKWKKSNHFAQRTFVNLAFVFYVVSFVRTNFFLENNVHKSETFYLRPLVVIVVLSVVAC
jgi:hypothetical protein